MPKDIPEGKPRPIDLEALLDPMALAKRVEYLEQVVGALVYAVRHSGMGRFSAGAFLEKIEIDPDDYRLL
jgi:hypothetical protein